MDMTAVEVVNKAMNEDWESLPSRVRDDQSREAQAVKGAWETGFVAGWLAACRFADEQRVAMASEDMNMIEEELKQ